MSAAHKTRATQWDASRALNHSLLALGLLAAGVAAAPALATEDNPWQRCRGIADGAARLACYDAVPSAAAGTAAPTTTAAPAAVARRAPPAAVPVVPAPAAVNAGGAQDSAVAAFGMEKESAQRVDAIDSHLPGPFEGWVPRQLFKLANGQVWQLAESGSAYYPNRQDPRISIRRAAFGSFLMDIEGVNQRLRVRRVQ